MKGFTLLSSNIVGSFAMVAIIVTMFQFQSCTGYNDDRGIMKWNPYWLSSSNSRYTAPFAYNLAMGRGGLPKRLGDRASSFGSQILKWSPNYFSDPSWFGRPMGVRYLNRFSNNIYDGLDINTEGDTQ